jgi:hypothetical protein
MPLVLLRVLGSAMPMAVGFMMYPLVRRWL